MNTRLSGFRIRSGWFGGKNNLLSLPGFGHRTVGYVASSRYGLRWCGCRRPRYVGRGGVLRSGTLTTEVVVITCDALRRHVNWPGLSVLSASRYLCTFIYTVVRRNFTRRKGKETGEFPERTRNAQASRKFPRRSRNAQISTYMPSAYRI